MTLRARLLTTVGALLVVALVVGGALLIGVTRNNLVADVDAELLGLRQQDIENIIAQQGPRDPSGRRFAILVINPRGEITESLASGIPGSLDALPSIPQSGEPALPTREIVERRSVDGAFSYRIRTFRVVGPPNLSGFSVAVAASLAGVDRSVAALVRSLLLVGLSVLVVTLVIGWMLIRRDLRPLERITGTAERIAAGDMSQRVQVHEASSEVGRLGHAFNTMLDQIQGAFESQRSALLAKERSETQLRQFVADASHELRTPLTAVRGYAELYRAGGLAEDEALDQAMSRIGTESRRMAALVEDLLLLARLDQGRPLRQDEVVLSNLVNDAVADARAVEPERPISGSVEPGVVVRGDEDRLRQVIGNLLANVRLHTPPSTAVEVALAARDGGAELRVSDHGPGVEPEHVEHVFDRFYRADTGRSRDTGGAGLGLSIAASVAHAHDGTIAYSNTEGGGATFTLTLPASDS
jgi:two-component system, OmpR family, sensor kinase